MICSSCGHDNIEGMDRCENCMKSFRDLDVPTADATDGLARSIMEDDLHELKQEDALVANSTDRAMDVVRRMKESNRSCALVTEKGKLAGIFTESDVLVKLAGKDAVDSEAAVSEVMTRNPETVYETDSIASALNKMSIGRYRHLPVVKSNGSYKVLSVGSLLSYIAKKNW